MQPRSATTKKSSLAPVVVIGAAALLFGAPCVIGILAAIAIPAFLDYVKRGKTAEAESNVRTLARLEESYCHEHGSFLFPAGPVPALPRNRKQVADFSSDPTFRTLGFAPAGSVYYSYSVLPQGVGEIVVAAHGDLDSDGVTSSFSIRCLSSCTCEATPTEADATE